MSPAKHFGIEQHFDKPTATLEKTYARIAFFRREKLAFGCKCNGCGITAARKCAGFAAGDAKGSDKPSVVRITFYLMTPRIDAINCVAKRIDVEIAGRYRKTSRTVDELQEPSVFCKPAHIAILRVGNEYKIFCECNGSV